MFSDSLYDWKEKNMNVVLNFLLDFVSRLTLVSQCQTWLVIVRQPQPPNIKHLKFWYIWLRADIGPESASKEGKGVDQ